MIGPFVHTIDPIIGKLGGFYIWWYGLSYTLGFLGLFSWLRRNHKSILMNMNEVYSLTIFISLGVLLGGRIIEVFFYEWAYYGSHLWHIPAVWIGGMSTHGILLGAIMGIIVFCLMYKWSFFQIADVLAIAAAYIMGVGRIGNFIDGQIVGSVTDAWWGVQFPDIEGYRHPVVLYDGIKNLLLIPLLLFIRRMKPPRGVLTAHFIFWYGFLRIFVDFFREYRTDFMGFPPGQEFNVLMTFVGLFLLFYFHRFKKNKPIRNHFRQSFENSTVKHGRIIWIKRIALTLLLVLPTIIPSDWTQDVPARYTSRHADISYSAIYPRLDLPSEGSQPSDQGPQQIDSDKK
ncbi:MAG: prolipoprotein diacylglyceryl transferase [Desulfobacterales bacterium]|nr:prolipoprotein diacylglyceryl transferase [Desulfobacterales bacterium]